MYLTYTIKTDAEVINKLGVIRGSVQRIVKLELAGIENQQGVDLIDKNFTEFHENRVKVFDENQEIHNSLNDLYHSWRQLKMVREIYRDDPSPENTNLLIGLSEEFWLKSNTLVYISQLVSEKKVDKYETSFFLFLINLPIGVLSIFLIKRYVKDKLEHLVNHDPLTKIYNRRYFNEYLYNQIQKSERYKRDMSFIFLDIDYFKKVNDNFGHDVGDSVLKELSHLIQTNIRKSDLLARLGGEEFGILVAENNVEKAYSLAEKLRKIVEAHDFRDVGKLTISLGVTEYVPGDNVDTIYKRVDSALYKAKNNGRNRSEILV